VVAGQGSQHIVELLAHNFTLIVTVFSIFAGSPAAGFAGFAFSAISGAIPFHWLAPIEAVPLLHHEALAHDAVAAMCAVSAWRLRRRPCRHKIAVRYARGELLTAGPGCVKSQVSLRNPMHRAAGR